jgi:hypothetical protein
MKIEKILSANDIGATGAHQAGILVPKQKQILDFFPKLDPSIKNPRTTINFKDSSGQNWKLNFIYYNNKFFGGTRNEYRLTAMTVFFKMKNLKMNDKVLLSKNNSNDYFIDYEKPNKSVKIKLSNNWKIIDL